MSREQDLRAFEDDLLGNAADDLIRECGGEPREALKRLINRYTCLEGQLRYVETMVSAGYARRKLRED